MKKDAHHIGKLLKALEMGEHRVNACKIAGISYDTFRRWMLDSEFSESIKKAEDAGSEAIEAQCLLKIQSAKEWQAAAWILERTRPDRYGSRQKLDHTSGGKPFNPIINVTTQAEADLLKQIKEDADKE